MSQVASTLRLILCTYRRLGVIFSLSTSSHRQPFFATVKTDCGDACSDFLAKTFPIELARNPFLISDPKRAMLEVWDVLEEKFYGICVQVGLTYASLILYPVVLSLQLCSALSDTSNPETLFHLNWVSRKRAGYSGLHSTGVRLWRWCVMACRDQLVEASPDLEV